MIVFGLKNCDTCRKAVKELKAAGHEAVLRDVRAAPLDAAELARFLDAFGDQLVNRRSTTWRGLSEEARAATPEALLTAHAALMKRPVIEVAGELYLGWSAEVKQALL